MGRHGDVGVTRPSDPRYQEHPFLVPPPSPVSSVRAGAVVVDGCSGLFFRPETLYVGTSSPTNSPDTVPGNAVFEFTGLAAGGGGYRRRFALQALEQVEIDVCGFRDVRLTVLGSNLIGFGVYAIATDRPATSNTREWLLYPTSVAAGTFIVPWGADMLFPASPDPAFTWRADDAAGAALTILDPAAPNQSKAVKGVRYEVSVPFQGVWRIRL